MAEKVYELRGVIYSQFKNESECARSMGWDRQKLSKITNGNKVPDISELVQLSQTLGLSLDALAKIFLKSKSPNEQQ